jgi:tetratricopeptide (TPR) repeat protein
MASKSAAVKRARAAAAVGKSATSANPGRFGSRWLFAIALIAATVLAYSNCFSSPFIMDDGDAIVSNPTIRSLSPISRTLSGPLQSSTAGRPLVNLSLALNYAAGELDPRGYHAVNLAIHILCGLLIFGSVRRTFSKASNASSSANLPNLVAFFCALVWLLHPLETEVINYVTQRTESLMALAYLATLYSFIRGIDSKRPWNWYAVSILSCALGMLCKESMATAPVMVLLYDAVFCAGSLTAALRRRAVLYAGLAASWIVLAVLLASNGRSHSAGFTSGVSTQTYLLNQGPIVLRYFRLAVWPTSLVFDYGLPKAIAWPTAILPALPVIGLAGVTAAAWFFDRRLAYLGTWIFVTLAPASTIIPIATEVGAERRMYLPMMAIAVLAVLGISAIGRRRNIFIGSVAAMCVTLGTLTFARNVDYRDPDGLWRQVIARYPHGRAHYNLAISLREQGQRAEAIREYQLAEDDMPDAQYALGFEAMQDRRFDEAITRLRRYLELKPLDINAIRASNLLGRALVAAGRSDEAAAAFRDTLRMHPDDAEGTGGLGQALLNGGHLEDALGPLSRYAQSLPTSAPAHFNVGLTLLKLHRFEEAAGELSKAASLNPRDPGAHANLATAYVQFGRFDDAIAEFRQASALESDPSAREEIAGLIAQLEAEKKGAGHR